MLEKVAEGSYVDFYDWSAGIVRRSCVSSE